jgi:hypothetical protein
MKADPLSKPETSMHLLAEKTVHIQQNALDVFAYVSNMENFGDWFPGVISIESSNALDHGQPGKQYLETVLVPLRGRRQITLEVREVREGHFFATEGRLPPLMPRMEIELRGVAAGSCDLTWRMFSRSDNAIVKYALLPLAKRLMEKRAALGVAALKKHMESR